MKNISLLFCILLFSFFSCSEKKEKKYYSDKVELLIGFKIPQNFILTQDKQGYAFGDYTETFEIQFNATDFNVLFNKLVNLKVEKINDTIYQISKKISDNEREDLLIYYKSHIIKFSHAEL